MSVGSGEALYIQIDRELQGHVSSDSLSCSIFKVPNHLRKINEMAYEPQVISIGPYHRGKDHLKAMEVHKKHYLRMLLDRNKEKTLKEYVEALESVKREALEYYSEPPDQEDRKDQFVEMMLFDGCFVVELIRKSAMKELREANDHLLTHFILRTVLRDLLLIENQLPFFILKKLFDMTKMPNEAHQNFMHMAINCFSIMMPGPCNEKIENHRGIKHLLGLLHGSCVSDDYGGSPEEDELLPESPAGVRLRSREAIAIVSSAKSVSSSTNKPSEIVRSLSSDAVLMNPNLSGLETVNSAESKSQVSDVTRRNQNCSASSVSFSPIKTSEEEKSMPSNTVLMTSQNTEIETESESFVGCESSVGATENCHHHPMKLSDATFVKFSASKTSKEAIPETAESDSVIASESSGSIGYAASSAIYYPPIRKAEAAFVRYSPTSTKGDEAKSCNWQTIRSASELHEAGIKFRTIEGKLFGISFEKGVMSIPTLKIVDDTESILRNLVAYEQCYKDISSRRFTEYIRFMDCLINTGKDVELLRHHEVIENRLGDNEVIADIFNRICDSVLIVEEDFFYSDIFNKVNKHCRRKWNQWKANLRHNYFNTPWASISVIAAVILLLLTVLQSVYSVLAYHHQQ